MPLKLSDAVRPAAGVDVALYQGYRLDLFKDSRRRRSLPMLAAAVDRDQLFEVFLDLLDPLGEEVHVVLETSHGQEDDHHQDLRRARIDLPVLKSHFCDAEELLVQDGCTGVAVVAKGRPIEVQFDEHKLLFVYARDLKPFRRILKRAGVRRLDSLRLVAEAEHLHRTTERHAREFEQLCMRIGVAEYSHAAADDAGY